MRTGRGARGGFTLIELLAVLVILSILMVVLLPRLGGFRERAKERTTKAWMQELSAAIAEYEDRRGDYPPSQFGEQWGIPPNATNLGGECLVIALWSHEAGGTSLRDDRFVNTDGDEAKKALSRIPRPALLELADDWGNPIAYFHRRDYTRQDTYLTVREDADEAAECTVRARKNPQTNTWFNPDRFQLISAGSDGEFGTEDDLANFDEAAGES